LSWYGDVGLLLFFDFWVFFFSYLSLVFVVSSLTAVFSFIDSVINNV
jgi:hypothetical protein